MLSATYPWIESSETGSHDRTDKITLARAISPTTTEVRNESRAQGATGINQDGQDGKETR